MGVSVFILQEVPVCAKCGKDKVLIELLQKFAEVLRTESPSRLLQQAKYLLRPKSAGRENGVSNSMRLDLGTLAGGSRWGLKIIEPEVVCGKRF